MKPISLLACCVLCTSARAVIPVTDYANLMNNRLAQVQTMAKWVESIAHLRTQIDQMKQQLSLQDDLHQWSGDPLEAGRSIVLDKLHESELVRDYGRARAALTQVSDSLVSLKSTADGTFQAIADHDLEGGEMQFTEMAFRRYAVLDAKQADAAEVADQTETRLRELQRDIAATLLELKGARTDAEVQKLSAKLAVMNGQLAQVEAERKRHVDEVALQKIANDARREQERLAAAELEAKDAYLAQQRVSTYMKSLRLKKDNP